MSTVSASTDSSPTNSSTLFESPIPLETPSTSPDSPASASSIHSYIEDGRPANLAHLKRPVSQARKPRNLKNLAVDTSTVVPFARIGSAGALTTPASSIPSFGPASDPSSPAFIRPLRTARKNSTLSLSIVTPSSSNSPSPTNQTKVVVPPTPSLVRPASLRRFQSSPLLPLLAPGLGPDGGMRLPALGLDKEIPVGFAEIQEHAEEDQPPNFDVPQSRDEQPAAYPDGPICIYDPHVYLYSEPTARVASEYDVIFNVASEVLNPFTTDTADAGFAATTSSTNNTELVTESDGNARSDKNLVAQVRVLQSGPADETSQVVALEGQPEYIHIPWEHNTDIVPDLYHLVKVIDERVQLGRKVLIHCQCGVSRSASLIVAYGLYRNPNVTVQEAYDAVKRRSRWIGPNMSLIMQLQEFRSGLLRSNAGFAQPRSRIKYSRRGTLAVGGLGRRTQLDTALLTTFSTPHSAPLGGNAASSLDSAIITSPGPSSAPLGVQFDLGPQLAGDNVPSLKTTAIPVVDPAGHLLKLTTQQLAQATAALLQPSGDVESAQSLGEPVSSISSARHLPLRLSVAGASIADVHGRGQSDGAAGTVGAQSERSLQIAEAGTKLSMMDVAQDVDNPSLAWLPV